LRIHAPININVVTLTPRILLLYHQRIMLLSKKIWNIERWLAYRQ